MNTAPSQQTAPAQPIPANDPQVPPVNPANLEEQKKASPKFAALIKKEKALVEKMRSMSEKEQALLARDEALKQREARLLEFENIRQASPVKALEMLGYNYNQLSEAMMNEGKPTPEMQINQIQEKVSAWQKAQEDKEAKSRKEAEERALTEQKEILEAFQGEIDSFVTANKGEYPFIDLYSQSRLVYSTIDDHYNKTGKIVSIKEACDHVEKFLEAEAEKAMQIEKFRNKIQPQQPPSNLRKEISREPWGNPKPAATKTLSNQMPPADPNKAPHRPLTEEEKIRRAVDRVWGNR